MTTGAISAADLAEIRCRIGALEPTTLTGEEQLALVEELRALAAATAAAQARASVAFATTRVTEAQASGASLRQQQASATNELALAHRISPAAMGVRLERYRRLVSALPATLHVLASGESSEHTVMTVARAAHSLTDLDLRTLDEQIAPILSRLTPRQADGHTRRYCAQLDPQTAIRRIRRAESESTVSIRPVADGMARISILSPLVEAVGMYAALRRDAQGSPRAGTGLGRRMTQLAFERITGLRDPGQIGVEIQLVMTDHTLLGTAPGQPARLAEATTGTTDGWLPVDIALDLALRHGKTGDSGTMVAPRWIRRLFTDPATGTLTAMDTRRREFTEAQRRYLATRDQYCTTPWCGGPIRHADHATPHTSGGPTSLTNGNGKCQRCNQTKDSPGWTTTATPARPGRAHTVTTTTPTGRSYTTESPPLLAGPEPQPPAPHPIDIRVRGRDHPPLVVRPD